ncbi:CAP domain-containing protein [Streptomyces sp. NBC_01716]|uniref:CAP domain-containing protein n=1 Tax=Streptomyces sp. NBC_01716 TaxID=2975917 RepID=UPI002E364460|nr:CAP domain-containing protein [Streptomyces sp. NBC_01716]
MSSPFKASEVKAARAGDRAARDRLGQESLPLVHQLVGHALHGHPEVGAVARETVRHAIDGLDGLRRPADFRPYLVTTTVARIREHADYLYDPALHRPDFDFVDLMISRLGLTGQHREVAEATRWVDREHHTLVALWWLECAGELTRPEVAAALTADTQHVAARVERMEHELETARVVVRALSAEPPCVLLEQLTGGWGGIPSPLWRERIAGHIYECTVCSGYAAGLVPADILVADLPPVPLDSRPGPSGSPSSAHGHVGAGHGSVSAGGDDAGARGRTRARDAQRRDRRAKRRRVVTVTAAVAALVAAAGAAQFVSGERNNDESRASTAVEPETLEPKSAVSPTKSAGPSPSPSRTSASPSPSPTRSPSKKAAKPSKPAPDPRPTTAEPGPKPDPKPTTNEPEPGGGGGGFAEQVTTLVNSERSKAGCGPVTANSQLETAALRHSQDMAAKDYFDHTSPDGRDPGDRITAAGYRWTTYGENIARGQQTPASVMEGWMNSPGHRANILNCAFKEIGVGVHDASGGPWWTQAFGARG